MAAVFKEDLGKIKFFSVKVNPDHSFTVFAVQEQKPKRWYGFDCSNPDNPVSSTGAPVDLLGEFTSYDTAAEMAKRAEALRREFNINFRALIAKGLRDAE